MDVYMSLPDTFANMYETVSSLGTLDPSTTEMLSQFQMTEPGKRQWETSETGYLKWAVRQLLAKGRPVASTVEEMKKNAEDVGTAEDLRKAVQS
jgi:kinetochore protein Mis12/MTW1